MLRIRTQALAITAAALLSLHALPAAAAAEEIDVIETIEASNSSTTAVNRDLASKANASAAREAADSVLADTKLDLDIRLVGRTSLKIASRR